MTTTTTIDTTASMTSRPSDITSALRWLNHGAELAYDLKGTKAKHSDVIWQLLIEAIDVIDKQPDRERRWLTSGTRSSWKAPGLSRADLAALERLRVLSAMRMFDSDVTKYMPQRDDEERALGVLGWMRWLNAANSGGRLSRAAVELALGGDTEIVAKLYAPTRSSRHRQLAYEIKTRTAGLIEAGLRDDLGIIRSDGIRYMTRLDNCHAA